MNIWSYTIYGRDTEKYYKPMIKNFEIAEKNNVKIILNISNEDKDFVLNYFSDYLNKFILEVHDDILSKEFPKILRYIIAKKYMDYNFFYKDSDSIVTDIEIQIMKEWLNSKESDFLIIRNHPLHVAPILAGMFAVKSSKISFLLNLIDKFFKKNYLDENKIRFTTYDYDQVFLQSEVYPLIKDKASIYSSHFYFCDEKIIKIPFSNNFIGKQIYKNEPENDSQWYYKIYNRELLCIPYFHSLYKFYKYVRVSLILSKIINVFRLKKL